MNIKVESWCIILHGHRNKIPKQLLMDAVCHGRHSSNSVTLECVFISVELLLAGGGCKRNIS